MTLRVGVCGWCRARDEVPDRIVGWIDDADEAWVAFDIQTMFEDALRFRERVG